MTQRVIYLLRSGLKIVVSTRVLDPRGSTQRAQACYTQAQEKAEQKKPFSKFLIPNDLNDHDHGRK